MEDIYPLTVTLTKKEAIMCKVKLIVHEPTKANAKARMSMRRCFLFYILIDKEPDYPYYSGNDGAHLVVVIYTNNPCGYSWCSVVR